MTSSNRYPLPTINYIHNICTIYTLHQAVLSSDIDKIKLLLNRGCNINKQDQDGNTALFHAIEIKNPYIVELLVRNNADVNTPNKFGHTPLFCAIVMDDADICIVELLVQKGAKINAQDKAGNAALRCAIEIKNPYIIELLVQKGANINAQDEQGKTYLHKTTDWQLAEYLKNLGARSDIKDHFGKTACDYAAEYGNFKLLAILEPKHHLLHPDEGSHDNQEASELIGVEYIFQKFGEN